MFFINSNKINIPFLCITPDCPSSGSQYIDNPSSSYTKIVENIPSYTCGYDECLISGSMEIDKAFTTNTTTCTECKSGTIWYNSLISQYGRENLVGCTPPGSIVKYWKACTGGSTTIYEANFNFCPETDLNFAYCKGSKNNVSELGSFFTTEKKITKGKRID